MGNCGSRWGLPTGVTQLGGTELGPEPRPVPQKALPPDLCPTRVTRLLMHELPCRVDASSRRSTH